jgi:hypothetical protein
MGDWSFLAFSILWFGLVAVAGWVSVPQEEAAAFRARLSQLDSRVSHPDDYAVGPQGWFPRHVLLKEQLLVVGAVLRKQVDPSLEGLRAPVRAYYVRLFAAVFLGWLPAAAVVRLLASEA